MQSGVTKLARPATSVLRLQARSSTGNAFICPGCLQSRQHLLLPPSQSRPVGRRTHLAAAAVTGLSRISRTYYSTSTSSPEGRVPPPSLITRGIARLSSRRLISVSGPDAVKYLQGAITANVTARTDPFYAAFLAPKGRVLHDVFIYPLRNPNGEEPTTSFLIEVDAAEEAQLRRHIMVHKLRSKFTVELVDNSKMQIWHAWGVGVEELDALNERDILIKTPDPRAPGMGWRIISQSQSSVPPLSETDLPVVSEEAYTLHRYSLGVPEGQREIIRNQALPLESNIDLMGGIDFRKGCYVGQELTIRTQHRGVVRKRILPVVLSADDGGDGLSSLSSEEDGFDYKPGIFTSSSASSGEEEQQQILLPDSEAAIGRKEKGDGGIGERKQRPQRPVGVFLGGIGNVGLALCRLDAMTDLSVAPELTGGFDPEKDEFVVKAGTGRSKTEDAAAATGEEGEENTAAPAAVTEGPLLRVRAFVPKWFRSTLGSRHVKKDDE